MVIVVRKILKYLCKVLEFVVILFVIFMTTCLLCRNQYGNTQFGDYSLLVVTKKNKEVLSDFNTGDLVVIKQVEYDDVNIGDKLYYYVAKNKKYHLRQGEVIDKEGDYEASAYKFNEEVPTLVAEEKIVGSLTDISYHGLGNVLSFLTSRFGFLIFVILPMMLIFIYHVYSLVILIGESKKQLASLSTLIDEEKAKNKEVDKNTSPTLDNVTPLPSVEPMPSLDEIRQNLSKDKIKPIEEDDEII